MNRFPRPVVMALIPLLLSACGTVATANGGPLVGKTTSGQPPRVASEPLPHGVMPAARACRLVVQKAGTGFFTGIRQVHLVLTSYARGEPVESQGDISTGMPPRTLVWVVEVHAKAIHWNHSMPVVRGSTPKAAPPDTDYSVVMNARTGDVSDAGEGSGWPLPLSRVGTVVSLPPGC